jgi:hypothetical protein
MGTTEDSGHTQALAPDPTKHKHISFVKSAFRIWAAAALSFGFFVQAGVLFAFAEILGIAEELV